MATAPVKPQQLHNFPISLKWGQTTTTIAGSASSAVASSHHHRSTNHNHRLMTTTMTTSSTVVHDSETESDPEHPQSIIPNRHAPPHRVGSRSARAHRFSFASCSNLLPKVKPEIPQKSEVAGKPDKNVIVLDKNNSNEESGGGGEEEEDASRPWKLRPRKGIATGNKETAAFHANEQSNNNNNNTNTTQFQPPKSTRLRGLIESSSSGGGGLGLGLGGVSLEKKEKRKFWIALSRDEIEEDIFALTGSRPARRPKKRPKNVQKVLDCVFPGLWLVGTTADSYRVADPPVKASLHRLGGQNRTSSKLLVCFAKI